MISILLLTYEQPTALELCLESIVKNQAYKNQILVVENGYCEENKPVFEKYKEYIDVLPFATNVGMNRAINLGVCNIKHELVFIGHDDMVYPKNFDLKLLQYYKSGMVLTSNSIEPYPSMFQQFVIKDLGRSPKTFNIEKFNEYESSIAINKLDDTGSTFPFLISKLDYLRIGGFDEMYPLNGVVADWDFFLKCQLSGLKMLRTYVTNIYHFVSLSTNISEEQKQQRHQSEVEGHTYAQYKWGTNIKHNPQNNLKYL